MTKIGKRFENSDFEFVSDFGFRASDFVLFTGVSPAMPETHPLNIM